MRRHTHTHTHAARAECATHAEASRTNQTCFKRARSHGLSRFVTAALFTLEPLSRFVTGPAALVFLEEAIA